MCQVNQSPLLKKETEYFDLFLFEFSSKPYSFAALANQQAFNELFKTLTVAQLCLDGYATIRLLILKGLT